MSKASKGARLERHVINCFVREDPEHRIAIKSAASKTDIDFILIDKLKGKIILGQAKNWKEELGPRARETIIKPLKKFEGNYTVEAKFYGKEELRNDKSLG